MASVRPLGRREIGAAGEPMVSAFWNYPETVHLLPTEGGRRRVLPRYLGADARDAASFGQRFDFRVVDEYRPTSNWPTVWNLWSDPRASSG